MAESGIFQPTWLFSPQGEARLCETEEMYNETLALGWGSNLLEMGIETHPAATGERVTVQSVLMPPLGTAPPPPPPDLMEKLDAWTAGMEQQMRQFEQAQALLHERLEALESLVTHPQTPLQSGTTSDDSPPDTSGSSGRRRT